MELVYILTTLISGRGHVYTSVTPPVAHTVAPNPALTIFRDNRRQVGVCRYSIRTSFKRTFTAEEQNKHLSDKLMQELPGILNWAIEGCLEWQRNGLQTPQIVDDQVAEYKSAMDSISQFVNEECELGKDHSYAASKFFQTYRDWCSGAGRKPQSTTAFKRSLGKLTGVYQHRSSNGLQWHGIQPCLAY